MANYKFETITSNDGRLRRLKGLASIQTRDLGRIRTLAKILLAKVDQLPRKEDELAILDALYTTVFVRYRRCFNASMRGAGLERLHVPQEYLELHDFLLTKANTVYAHAIEEKNSLAYQVDSDSGEKKGISPITEDDIYPLNSSALNSLIELIDVLSKLVLEKQKEIQANHLLQPTPPRRDAARRRG